MALFEVWCSACNEAHDPHTNENDGVRSKIQPGSRVWILLNKESAEENLKGKEKLLGGKQDKKAGRSFRVSKKKAEAVKEPEKEWKDARVIKRWGNHVKVQTNDILRTVKVIDLDKAKSTCLPANSKTADDMTDLHFTHEPAILENLKLRAKEDKPYTFIGNVLVSINPLHKVPEPTEDSRSLNLPHPVTVADRAYRKMCFAASQLRRLQSAQKTRNQKLSPSKASLENGESNFAKSFGLVNQSIVISGESGSGKTEASKRVVCYLVEREGYLDYGDFEDEESAVYDFQDRLIGADPILESFGNARTLRNPNSSRFGKFLKLKYQSDGNSDDLSLSGASITTYLLERSRVSYQEPGEKNYRIFYQLLTYKNRNLARHLGFEEAGYKFRYLAGGKKFTKADQDRIGVVELTTALAMAKLKVKNIKIFQIVAAILHLGNVEFYDDDILGIKGHESGGLEEDELERRRSISRMKRSMRMNLGNRASELYERRNTTESMPDGSFAESRFSRMGGYESGSASGRSSFAFINRATRRNSSYDALALAAKLLYIKEKALEEILLYKVIYVAGKRLKSPLDAFAASRRRDALAKDLYALLFDYIVGKLNEGLVNEAFDGEPDLFSQKKNSEEKKSSASRDICAFIGVLDVFGFESFKKNGFEQLLINYANEVLLSLFTREVLIGESEVYMQEGLMLQEKEMKRIEDTKAKYEVCLSLFEGKNGIFDIMDTALQSTKPTEKKLLSKIQESCSKKRKNGNTAYVEPHPSKRQESFIIRHYSSTVTYTVGTFLEKNDQTLPVDVEQLFTYSRHPIVQSFPVLSRERSAQGKNANSGNIRKNKGGKFKKKTNKKKTVVSMFSQQIEELKTTLNQTGCSYIRCVKPNPSLYFNPNEEDEGILNAKYDKLLNTVRVKTVSFNKKRRLTQYAAQRNLANTQSLFNRKLTSYAAKQASMNQSRKRYFEPKYISDQLKNMGIYDSVSILKSGLPTKIPYPSFMNTYEEILPLDEVDDKYFTHRDNTYRTKMYVAALLNTFNIDPSSYRLGATRIFLEHSQLDKIKEILKSGLKIEQAKTQKAQRKKQNKLKKKMQRYLKKKLLRVRTVKLLTVSMFLISFRKVRSVRTIQKAVRHFLARIYLEDRIIHRICATKIQTHWRAYIARLRVDALREEAERREAEELLKFADDLAEGGEEAEELFEEELGNFEEHVYEEDLSEYSVTDYGNNAMRNTLLSYYNRKQTTPGSSLFRKQGNVPGAVDRLNEFRQSKLGSAEGLFDMDILNEAADDNWEQIDYAFAFDGENEFLNDSRFTDLDDVDLSDETLQKNADPVQESQLSRFMRQGRAEHVGSSKSGSKLRRSPALDQHNGVETVLSRSKSNTKVSKHSRGSGNAVKKIASMGRKSLFKARSKTFRKKNILSDVSPAMVEKQVIEMEPKPDPGNRTKQGTGKRSTSSKKKTMPRVGGVLKLAAMFGTTLKKSNRD
eukprot:snap_masked-scaffold_27-processed-gene-2.50-mRNA-1 protein AED:0.37 eAED:0.37 QI:0/-1/0/1/-1/1/1/0/1465